MSELHLTGDLEKPANFTAADLAAFPASERVDDIRSIGAARDGSGVYLRAILSRARPGASVRFITFRSPSDDFSASVPLDRVLATGVVIYATRGGPLTREQGGPFRFIIPDPAACQTDEIDECVNVKYLEEIGLSRERGRDTRPEDEAEHARIHS